MLLASAQPMRKSRATYSRSSSGTARMSVSITRHEAKILELDAVVMRPDLRGDRHCASSAAFAIDMHLNHGERRVVHESRAMTGFPGSNRRVGGEDDAATAILHRVSCP